MSEHSIETPDETRLWLREQLARIDQQRADADRKRQETELAPYLLRVEMWKAVAAMIVAVGAIFGAALAVLKFVI